MRSSGRRRAAARAARRESPVNVELGRLIGLCLAASLVAVWSGSCATGADDPNAGVFGTKKDDGGNDSSAGAAGFGGSGGQGGVNGQGGTGPGGSGPGGSGGVFGQGGTGPGGSGPGGQETDAPAPPPGPVAPRSPPHGRFAPAPRSSSTLHVICFSVARGVWRARSTRRRYSPQERHKACMERVRRLPVPRARASSSGSIAGVPALRRTGWSPI